MSADSVLKTVATRVFALPDEALRVLAGKRRRSDHDVALDPALSLLLAMAARLRFPKTDELSPLEARAQTVRDGQLVGPTARQPARVEDRLIPGPGGALRVRAYVPEKSANLLPVLVYFHGGGFVVGDLDSHDRVCRRLAQMSRCIVVSVDYRLAPEHRYPAAVHDAEAAFCWVAEHAESFGGDPARVAIGGDSAGANLSAVVSRRLRDAGGAMAPRAQLLVYPGTDLTMSRPSIQTFARGFFLERVTIEYFRGTYLEREEQATEIDASPLFEDDLAELPPAIVATAGFDPLRDEGDEYAARLRDAGVRVEHTCHESLVHGFVSMSGVSRASLEALDVMARDVGALLYG